MCNVFFIKLQCKVMSEVNSDIFIEYDNDENISPKYNKYYMESINKKPYDEEINYVDKTKLSDLEFAVLKNDYDHIINLLNTNHKIYHYGLCNGFYNRINKTHPKKCNKYVCYKNALYYSLINNCRGYYTLCSIIIKLLDEIPEIRILCRCCKIKNTKSFTELSECIHMLISELWELTCECKHKLSYYKIYTINFLNLCYVYDIMTLHIPKIIDKLANIFSYSMECEHKGIMLESFDYCIHDNLKYYITHREHLNNNIVHNHELISQLKNELNNVYSWYNDNCRICLLLFNQQNLEALDYFILKHNDSDIYNRLKILLDNKYINLDFATQVHQNMLSTCIINGLQKSSNLLITLGSKKIDINAYTKALNNKKYDLCYDIFQFICDNYNAIVNAIIISDMDITLKSKFLTKIINMDYKFTMDQLSLCLQTTDSIEIIELIVNVSGCSLGTIHTTVNINNINKFKLIMDNYNGKYYSDRYEPLIFYLLDKPHLLEIYLLYNSDVNILDSNNISPLWYACQNNYIDSCKILLTRGADYTFIYNGLSCIMVMVQNNNIIDAMLDKQINGEYIINMKDNNNFYPILAALYTKNFNISLNKLSKLNYINVNVNDMNGLNIFSHIIKKNINNNDKEKLIKNLINKFDFNAMTHKSFLSYAVEKDNYMITKFIYQYLIDNNLIILSNSNQKIKNLDMSFKYSSIDIKTNCDGITCHLMVYNYLKHAHKTANYKINNALVKPLNEINIILTILMYSLYIIHKKLMN